MRASSQMSQMSTWEIPFSKSKLNALERTTFDEWIDRVYSSYRLVLAGRAPQLREIPKGFLLRLSKEQKGKQEGRKWTLIEALGGGGNGAMVINDGTEKLETYLGGKDSRFGKFISFSLL